MPYNTAERALRSVVAGGGALSHTVLYSTSFSSSPTQLSLDHRIVILNSIERIAQETLEDLDARMAVDLIQLASQELTQSKVSRRDQRG